MPAWIAPLSLVLFFCLSYLSLQTPVDRIEETLRQAFASGQLTDADWPSLPPKELDSQIGFNQYNDCLIFLTTILRGDVPIRTAVSPNVIWWWPYGDTTWSRCGILNYAVHNPLPPDAEEFIFPYHRYLLGHRLMGNFLLPLMSVRSLRLLLTGLSYGVLLSTLVICLVRLGRRVSIPTRILEERSFFPACMALILVAFLSFYGLPYFAMSISHGPSEIILFGFLLYSLHNTLIDMEPGRFYAVITLFACLTSFFEFLTGPAPLGLAILIATIALQATSSSNLTMLAPRLILGTFVYVGSILFCFASKQLVAASLFGTQALDAFVDQLAKRTWGEDEAGDASIVDGFTEVLNWAQVLGQGSESIGQRAFGTSMVLLVFSVGYVLSRSSSNIQKARAFGVVLSVAAIFAWYSLFKNHTVVHPFFMVRLLAWPIAMGWVALLIALGVPSRTSSAGPKSSPP